MDISLFLQAVPLDLLNKIITTLVFSGSKKLIQDFVSKIPDSSAEERKRLIEISDGAELQDSDYRLMSRIAEQLHGNTDLLNYLNHSISQLVVQNKQAQDKIVELIELHFRSIGETQQVQSSLLQEILNEIRNPKNLQKNIPLSRTAKNEMFDTVIIERLDVVTNAASNWLDTNLAKLRIQWQEGKHLEVLAELNLIRSDQEHRVLIDATPSIKAKYLRFEASIILATSNNFLHVESLLDEAIRCDQSLDLTRIRSIIISRTKGTEEAAESLINCNDIDSINLRAFYLLMSRKIVELHNLLDVENTEFQLDAESYRLKALACINPLLINQAQGFIQQSMNMDPLSLLVRATHAIIKYYCALSPVALEDGYIGWPSPVDRLLIREDDEAIALAIDAASIFAHFAESLSLSSDERRYYKIWQIACLDIIKERQDEAAKLCKDLLNEDPTNNQGLAWANYKGWSYNESKCLQEVQDLIGSTQLEIQHIAYLVEHIVDDRMTIGAIELLEENRQLFLSLSAAPQWYLCITVALLRQHRKKDALEILDEEVNTTWIALAREFIAEHEAQESGDWSQRIATLETLYNRFSEPSVLITLCRIKADLGDWQYIADRADRLITSLQTGACVRFAVDALYKAGRYEYAINVLENNIYRMRGHRLSLTMQHVRAACYLQLKQYELAFPDIKYLADDTPSLHNLHNLLFVGLAIGDQANQLIAAQKIISLKELTAMEALRTSQALLPLDQQLSGQMFTKACELGIPDEGVLAAVSIAGKLGEESKINDLMARLPELAKSETSGVFQFHQSQLVPFLLQRREETERLVLEYQKGNLPIHFLPQQLNFTLAEPYHFKLRQHEKKPMPRRQFALMCRHGSRASIDSIKGEQGKIRLHVDITSLLLASHFNLLQLVEKCFGPIFIPGDTILLLNSMRSKQMHHQITQMNSAKEVTNFVEQGKIEAITVGEQLPVDLQHLLTKLHESTVRLLALARNQNGYLLDFLPLTHKDWSGNSVDLPADLHCLMINSRDILESLRKYGPINESLYKSALSELHDNRIRENACSPIVQNRPIYCSHMLLTELHRLGILKATCQRFAIRLDRLDFEGLKEEIIFTEEFIEDSYIDNLIKWIGLGLKSGRYILISSEYHANDDNNFKLLESLELKCLTDIHGYRTDSNDVIWCDDRFINSYRQRESNIHIITICEILKHLFENGFIDEDFLYMITNRLRAGNVRFIPLTRDELLYHLQGVSVNNGKMTETTELTILNEYYTACLSSPILLQTPSFSSDAPFVRDEIPFIVEFLNVLSDVTLTIRANINLSRETQDILIQWVKDLGRDHYISAG